ncbi:hypothetical protein [Paraflavitalea speifideaquila]|uniref:hypothetical protein n=1 Tax=Paraflavitalea speifideaquila TaxID=3076558 RepID=UPI0028EE1670|nr:hypothetical protein [Paraflavitalea speifideiaquila]
MAFTIARHVQWESRFVQSNNKGQLRYTPDEKGNIIPDFSRVGYYQGDKAIPEVGVSATITPSEDAGQKIQAAIDALANKAPDKNGFRGAILLKKGSYQIPVTLQIKASGIVLRGEGDTENGTKLIATGTTQKPLIAITGSGNLQPAGNRIKITDRYVPVGSFSFSVNDAQGLQPGDAIIVNRPGTDKWIEDTKMNQIEERNGTKQWKAAEYNLEFERTITKIEGHKIFIDNPIMQALDEQYGGGEIYKYSFTGRIREVGVENLYMESVYGSDTAESHAWDAISINKAEQGWVRNVTSRYFAYACVNLGDDARYFTVTDSKCLDAKSQITGGRRYSFNNNGQCNLVMNCQTTEGRHDYVTGSKTPGPNVFYNCTAKNTHADIGPHHRWAVGTLYDNITTDGEINVQDRGNWGSGHGWAGVTQVLWNCTVKRAAVQSPWASGKNYNIGMKGAKYDGRLKGRPDGEWEGQNKDGLQPASLYLAQLKARQGR